MCQMAGDSVVGDVPPSLGTHRGPAGREAFLLLAGARPLLDPGERRPATWPTGCPLGPPRPWARPAPGAPAAETRAGAWRLPWPSRRCGAGTEPRFRLMAAPTLLGPPLPPGPPPTLRGARVLAPHPRVGGGALAGTLPAPMRLDALCQPRLEPGMRNAMGEDGAATPAGRDPCLADAPRSCGPPTRFAPPLPLPPQACVLDLRAAPRCQAAVRPRAAGVGALHRAAGLALRAREGLRPRPAGCRASPPWSATRGTGQAEWRLAACHPAGPQPLDHLRLPVADPPGAGGLGRARCGPQAWAPGAWAGGPPWPPRHQLGQGVGHVPCRRGLGHAGYAHRVRAVELLAALCAGRRLAMRPQTVAGLRRGPRRQPRAPGPWCGRGGLRRWGAHNGSPPRAMWPRGLPATGVPPLPRSSDPSAVRRAVSVCSLVPLADRSFPAGKRAEARPRAPRGCWSLPGALTPAGSPLPAQDRERGEGRQAFQHPRPPHQLACTGRNRFSPTADGLPHPCLRFPHGVPDVRPRLGMACAGSALFQEHWQLRAAVRCVAH